LKQRLDRLNYIFDECHSRGPFSDEGKKIADDIHTCMELIDKFDRASNAYLEIEEEE
jgi:hypothetical protein